MNSTNSAHPFPYFPPFPPSPTRPRSRPPRLPPPCFDFIGRDLYHQQRRSTATTPTAPTSRSRHLQLFRGRPDSDRPEGDSTDPPQDIRGPPYRDVKTLLLPGGVTVRSGPWLDDQGAPSVWGHAAAGDGAPKGESLWAVEVGWFVHDEQLVPGDRVVLTTLLDARSMTPLGAWRGEEMRSS